MRDDERPVKVVLTGGAWAGKTTLAHQLAGARVRLVPEAALHVISELTTELGLLEQGRWRATNPVEFQRRIARTQLAWEASAERSEPASVLVCDRGVPDGLAYLRHVGVEPPPDLQQLFRATRYDAVFVLETLEAFDPRTDSGRTDDQHASLALRDELLRVYGELGHRPIRVPPLPPRERLAWVRREWSRLGYPEPGRPACELSDSGGAGPGEEGSK